MKTETKTLTESEKAAGRLKFKMQGKVYERAEREIENLGEYTDRRSLMMDLHSVPELDLEKLLAAPKLDFAHDILGIIRHMDRSQYPGKLTGCFWPRCAVQS